MKNWWIYPLLIVIGAGLAAFAPIHGPGTGLMLIGAGGWLLAGANESMK